MNTLLFHLPNQIFSVDTFHDQNNNYAEKLKNEVIHVFTQTDFED